jgi:hypothetical protein
MVLLTLGIALPPGSGCCHSHIYDDPLSWDALLNITHTRVDVVSVDANVFIELLNDCFMAIPTMKTFGFDDPTSLGHSSYHDNTGLRNGATICLLHMRLFCIT